MMHAYSLDSMFCGLFALASGSRWKLQLGLRFVIAHGSRCWVAPVHQRVSWRRNCGSHFCGSSAVTAAHTYSSRYQLTWFSRMFG